MLAPQKPWFQTTSPHLKTLILLSDAHPRRLTSCLRGRLFIAENRRISREKFIAERPNEAPVLRTRWRLKTFRHAHEQGPQPFRHRRMRKHCVPQSRIRQASQHRELNRTHQFAGLRRERRESENAVTMCVDDRLHEPAFLRNSPGPPAGVDRHGRHTVGRHLFPRLRLVQADTRQFGIDEDAVRNQPVRACCAGLRSDFHE